jgi:23S rRNA pseudouridine955/2504/2580 synthase
VVQGVQTLEVRDDEDGMRLDRWIKLKFPDMPHSRLQKAMRKGELRIDGGRVKSDARVGAGQTVRIPPYEPASTAPHKRPPKPVDPKDEAFAKKLVIFRNDAVLAIDKPPGLAVQGGSKTERHVDAMLEFLHFEDIDRPRLVHRLDKDTSGVMLLARNRNSAAALGQALKGREVKKIYWAITVGVPTPHEGSIHLPLSKLGGPGGEKVVPDEENGDVAITEFKVLDQAAQKMALVALWPRTGRTHQIRAHLAALGTPILGDGKYGGKAAFPDGDELPKGMHLHARSIVLPPGISGAGTLIKAAPPSHFRRTLALFEFDTSGPDIEDPFAELEQ